MPVRPKEAKRIPSKRRIGAEDSETRASLLRAAWELMLAEGYAAVTSRRVAAQAELKPQLVHYYFRTMDELFLAMLQQGVERNLALLQRAMESPQPLRELWRFNTKETQLVIEFAALANHRPAVREALATHAVRQRRMQLEALSTVCERYGIDATKYPPAAVVLLITAVSRILTMEENVMGLTVGHKEMRAVVERLLSELEGKPSTTRKARAKRA